MVFALVAFIVATLIGLTIVNAALLNVRRAASEENEESAYLAVTSAAYVIRECLGDLSYKKLEGDIDEDKKDVMVGVTEENEAISKVILEMAKASSGSGSGSGTGSGGKDIKISGVTDIPDVEGKITMDEKYNMKVILKARSKEKEELCEMVVGIRASYIDEFPEDKYDESQGEENTPKSKVKLVVQWPKDGIYIVSTKVKATTNGN